MKLRRWLDLRTPLYVAGIMILMAVSFAIGLTVDRLIKLYKERRVLSRS